MHAQQHYGKKGILLVNLGTPDAPTRTAVHRYLAQFLTDGRVIDYPFVPRQLLVRGIIAPIRSGLVNPFSVGGSTKLYDELWTENGSPLKYYGEQLAAGVAEAMGDEYIVKLAMRYQQPSIEDAINELLAEQVASIMVLPLFPQYASATTGSVHQEVMRIVMKQQNIPDLKFINSYYEHPEMVDIFARHAEEMGNLDDYDHIFFSYHGLPQRQLKKADDCNHCYQSADCCQSISRVNQFCYSAQCHATTRAIAKRLNLSEDQYTTCFQSRLGFDDWAKPYTIDVLKEQAEKGSKKLLCFSPAFVADCLETVIEIGLEYQEEFEEWGGERIDLVPSLNDDPQWIQAVVSMLKAEDPVTANA